MKNITWKNNDEEEKTKVMTKEEILGRILGGELSDYIELKSETRGDRIYVPEFKMEIKPIVYEVKERFVNLGFDMYSDLWGAHFFECSVGLGNDCSSAYGMAIGTFAFSFMQGLKTVADNHVKSSLTSSFAGREHKWKVYESNVVATGKKDEKRVKSDYWNLLKDDIVKRLGNQKAVCVKIFNSNYESKVTGECRINDVPVPELGEKVGELAKKWEKEGYKSEKQFFFIIQDKNTVTEYPYAGRAGEAILRSAVAEYLKVFSQIKSQEEYSNIVETTAAITGDKTLAAECLCFVAEMCAERVFDEVFTLGDSFALCRPDDSTYDTYKCQLSDYMPIRRAVFDTFSSGVLGEKTNQVFNQLVYMSSLRNLMDQIEAQGKKPEELKGMVVGHMLYSVPQDFEIR